ncbi:hypothetical protein [Dyella sp.]|uniref:hypothetical protein n=1 Tax=Dyella sp. TaxID=1869338 RepID=UPI002FD99E45
MWLDTEWQQHGLDALRATLDVDTRQRNEMIQFLMDEGFWDAEKLSWDGAIARWNDCLNPGKNSFFKIGELWALTKRFGRHDLFLAMAEDLGYEVRLRPTEERRQALVAQLVDVLKRNEAAISAARSELSRLHSGDTPSPGTRGSNSVVRFRQTDDDSMPGSF